MRQRLEVLNALLLGGPFARVLAPAARLPPAATPRVRPGLRQGARPAGGLRGGYGAPRTAFRGDIHNRLRIFAPRLG
jgi:hypothetical protein